MTNSKYEYVKNFEKEEQIIPDVYIVVRVDGRQFTPFCKKHELLRPIDDRLIKLMTRCGKEVMNIFDEIIFGFGESDEFSFVFKRSATIFDRRRDKIVSTIASTFSVAFVMNWKVYFQDKELQMAPTFDARLVVYPNIRTLRDYCSWRQVDTHINCLYNYALCCLLREGYDPITATETLKTTFSKDKNEILFKYGINYNNLPNTHRKGILLVRAKTVIETSEDLIGDDFWKKYEKVFDR